MLNYLIKRVDGDTAGGVSSVAGSNDDCGDEESRIMTLHYAVNIAISFSVVICALFTCCKSQESIEIPHKNEIHK